MIGQNCGSIYSPPNKAMKWKYSKNCCFMKENKRNIANVFVCCRLCAYLMVTHGKYLLHNNNNQDYLHMDVVFERTCTSTHYFPKTLHFSTQFYCVSINAF